MISKTFYMCIASIYLSTRLTLQASVESSTHYVGAVVEYYAVTEGANTTAIVNENAKNFVEFLAEASKQDVDIIVFPENGLFGGFMTRGERSTNLINSSTYVPHPQELHVSCHNASSHVIEAVKGISCAAKQYNMYIVINVLEKEKCTGEKCANGHNIYNTNVVFDRKGAIIARYRKWNLFGEKGTNVTDKPEMSTFRTDFNVTFGQFICFDIIFDSPANKLISEKKVTDIIFSTHWFSEMPFLTANSVQSGWSYAHDVNFLGSGFNNPATGSGGSGIYAGKSGHLTRIWSEKPTNSLLVAKIPKIVNGRRNQPINANDNPNKLITNMTQIHTTSNIKKAVTQQALLKDDIAPYTTQQFQPKNGTFNLTLCDRGLCCNFTTNTEHQANLVKDSVKYYRYRFAVFNGVRSYSTVRTGGTEVCGIIACTGDTQETCNQRFDSNTIIVQPTTFISIVISSHFKDASTVLRMPLSLNTEIHPLNVSDFTFTGDKVNATHVNLKYVLTRPRRDLMTFAIYGRNYTADGLPKTVGASAVLVTPISLMMMMLMIVGIINSLSLSLFSIAN